MQQNIDQQFREEIGRLEHVPLNVQRNPESNWQTIESMLDADKRKRRGAWIWVSTAAVLAILIAVGWAMLPEAQPDKNSFSTMLNDSPDSLLALEETKSTGKIDVIQFRKDALTEQTLANQPNLQQKDFVSGSTIVASNSTLLAAGSTSQNFATATYDQSVSLGAVGNNSGITNWTSGGTNAFNSPSTNTAYSVTPSSKAGYTYNWTLEDGRSSNKQANSGTYTVVVTDANGSKSMSKNVLRRHLGFKTMIADSISVVGFSEPLNTESYAETVENNYFPATQEPVSTFSIDVDRASYTNHRRYLDGNSLPPKYAVRVEEFINYFDYEYRQPQGNAPFSILPEVTTCPWNPKHKLVRIALKGREVATENLPPSNLVFLLDVSGSMEAEDKLPLLKKAMAMLTQKMREQDKISIVVYAGAAGLVLPPTSGSNKQAILASLDKLTAGGSTAGGEGIELAYATAKKNFKVGGNNRVILATDGDFNVGTSDESGLEKLIVKKREEGVFLSVLGFGEGNLQDSKMELLADKGNGNYNYLDGEREAQKVLVSEFGGTLYTIAKDVKIQVEFNPAQVESYRLIGYENRNLKNEDFANDNIDAGELGAGHTVTALYEIMPATSSFSQSESELKYQKRVLSDAATTKELLTVKLRYKEPDGTISKLLLKTLEDDGKGIIETSIDFRWAVAVAEYGLLLRESEYKGIASYDQVLALARSAIGPDKEGHRREFIQLVAKAANITQTAKGN